MSEAKGNGEIRSAFVTGATGLLGNNLVRLLISRGVRVKALARSAEKAAKQLANLPVEVVTGDMTKVHGFARHLRSSDVLFHTAAFFRENFKGGRHWRELRCARCGGSRVVAALHGRRGERYLAASRHSSAWGQRD